MNRSTIVGLIVTAAVGLLIGSVILLVVLSVRRVSSTTKPPRAAAGSVPAIGVAEPGVLGRKIKARLFYVSQDGTRLTGVER